jgi:hypothetical protein
MEEASTRKPRQPRRPREPTIAEINARSQLIAVGQRRKTILDQVIAIQRAANERHANERARAKEMHLSANAELVEAIEDAIDAGMKLVDIAKALEVSTQTLRQIRLSVAEPPDDPPKRRKP